VYTADDHGAGTDASVQMVIYGKNEKGESIKSDEIPLDNSGDNFESGQEDQFKIETIDVGRPYKIRVWHDNARSFAAWKLDRVSFYRFSRYFILFSEVPSSCKYFILFSEVPSSCKKASVSPFSVSSCPLPVF